MTEYKDHPLSSVLPLMGQMEIQELAADIQANGLRAPITLLDNQILDGRNRYRACKVVGVEPKFREFNGDGDPLDFIVSVNVKRRHLTTSQRALVAAKIANLPKGDIARFSKSAKTPINSQSAILRSGEKSSKTTDRAAQELNVSPRTVTTAKRVLKQAPEEEIEKVERGEKTVATVARETKPTKKAETTTNALTDQIGRVIPKEILAEWQRAETVGRKLRNMAREIKNTVEKGFAGAKQDKLKDQIYAEVGNAIIAEAGALAYTLDSIIPYALCPTCQGRLSQNCTLCKQRGWISRFLWNSPSVSKETRELIGRQYAAS